MYCGRALVPSTSPPSPAPRIVQHEYVAPPPAAAVTGSGSWAFLGAVTAVLAVVGVTAFRVLEARVAPSRSVPAPTAVATPVAPDVPDAPAPLPRLAPVPVVPTKAPATGPPLAAASAHPSVSVAVGRHDAAVTPTSSLIGFVQPARACFDKPKQRLTIELEFSAGGQLVSAHYARSEYDAPMACVSARIDALRGSALSGYRTGEASRATLQMGS